ncbi:MAG: alpha/beta hydrolase [Actinobacteria bacterium]|nr:alpha/beta hydrolase [Actinomycetota bacterium]MBU1942339.1 alpha/beta hydrolase [Actinomycetota bacterium]MBU2686895.1 alpha/beta hydrolase [Actinomycetota bacterium]
MLRKVLGYVHKFLSALLMWLVRPILNAGAPPVVRLEPDIRYGFDSDKQRLDVVVPTGGGPFPVLVYVHGGSFTAMDKKEYTRIAKVFANAGFLVLNCNYRLAPGWKYPAQLEDVARAVGWALANVQDFGGDPERIFMAGDSAGAYLVSTYATVLCEKALARAFDMEHVQRPKSLSGLVLIYGAYDCETVLATGFPLISMSMKNFLGCETAEYRERAKAASPIRHIKEGYPPCFLTAGEKDHLCGQSLDFERELERVGIPHRSMYFPASECRVIVHGFFSTWWRGCAKKASDAAIAFLKEYA